MLRSLSGNLRSPHTPLQPLLFVPEPMGGGDLVQERIIEEMGPPVVDWAPAYIFLNFPGASPTVQHGTAVTYHSLTAGHHVLAPLGAAVGCACGLALLASSQGTGSSGNNNSGWTEGLLRAAGSSAFGAGCVGTVLGAYKQSKIVWGADRRESDPSPWTDDCIKQRAEALSANFPVRVMDLSVFAGTGLALGVILCKGGPSRVGLSPGIWGAVQTIGLGTTVGSLSAMGCIYANRQR
jgi:hypothetical protein